MSFDLTPDQRALRERYREVGAEIERRLAGASGPLPQDLWRWCGERGLFRLAVPEDAGGRGASVLETVLAMEGLGLGCTDMGFLFAVSAHTWGTALPLASLGTREQRRRWLGPLLDGHAVGAHAITEPDAGSDVRGMRTTARLDGDELVLDGHKHYITAAPRADLFVIYARWLGDGGDGGDGGDDGGDGVLSAVLVEARTRGMTVRDQPKLGLHGAPMGEVLLEGCRVPADRILGRPGSGMAQFTSALEWERACIMAPFVGAMQRQLDRAVRHARRRRQFQRPIGRFQSVANRIVDMKLRLDVARLLLYRAASLKRDGRRAPLETSEAKLFISEAFVASTLDEMQVLGGAGYLADAPVTRDLLDAPATTVFSGTSEIQRGIIARFLGL